jgi:dihydrofolate synthase/folylpolyglutamate synthase
VVEVGLGGRLDATNALDPEVSVITSISYDHTAILGRTLAAIAGEKAGILRTGRRAFLAQQRPAAGTALRRACRTVGAECQVVPPLAHEVPLGGAHQRQNAAQAIATARYLVNPTDEAIQEGLQRLRWPGRFERVGNVILDGAHNGASAAALAAQLQACIRPLHLVLGINRDKDARAVLKPLLPLASEIWATHTHDNVRALPAAELAHWCRRLGHQAHLEPNLFAALTQAKDAAGTVCVTGSLMLVGQAREALGLPIAERLWR